MTIQEVAKSIQQSRSDLQKPILIAIDGFGGSGKSTIANKLAELLGSAYVIPIDDFIVKERLLELSADEVLFDRKRLEQEVLIPARSGERIAYQRLEWVSNTLNEPIQVPVIDYLIIEGISSTHPDSAKYFNYKIWIEAPIEVAKQRGQQRDAGNENEEHWDTWAANDQKYQEKHHPEQSADFVIDNSADNSDFET
jgi:uridine kinase